MAIKTIYLLPVVLSFSLYFTSASDLTCQTEVLPSVSRHEDLSVLSFANHIKIHKEDYKIEREREKE